ncbi:hypothetical protein [Streptomyces sp. SID12501]|uniref:hypothetical protein n=1 Tax=Streptomyces sp. SID12501 TaxID=2706042 RepID=UPI0019415B5A|nr:hypothetical protein [Streptomyces sp. SID12501]
MSDAGCRSRGLDHSEAFGNNESVVVNDGGATQELGHAITPEELFVGSPPLCNIGVAAPLGSRTVLVRASQQRLP